MAVKKKATIRLNTYPIIEEAVYRGVLAGLNRAKKHIADPAEDYVRECIRQAVLSELCEVIDWGDS